MELSERNLIEMELQPYGDQAILINFQQKVHLDVNQQVMDIYHTIKHSKLPGVTFLIPAYCSLVIGYDPAIAPYNHLRKVLLNLEVQKQKTPPGRALQIPVCYEKPFALDLDYVLNRTKLTADEIIDLHTSQPFHVFMMGFLPGFAYMGPLSKALQCARKDTPRTRVPAHSVGIAGNQTGIYPHEAPGGWQIIGQTPLPTFRPQEENPFLLGAGDKVQFTAIDGNQHVDIIKQVEQGIFDWESIYET